MTSSGWTRQRRCEYRQTTVQEPWGATRPACSRAMGNLPDEATRRLPAASHSAASPRLRVRRGSVRAHRARRRGRGMAADIAIRRHVRRPRCRAHGQTGRSVVRATLAGRRARPTSTRQTAHCTTDSDMLETVGTVRRSAWSWAAGLLRRRISRCCRRAADAPLQASCPSATLCIRARRRPQRVKLPAGSPGLRRSCHRGHRIRLSKCVHKTGSRPSEPQRAR